jgi:outer membrane protein assembly factor BamB
VWRYDMMDELGVFPHNASNCSILIIGDLLYFCTSNGMDWTHSNVPSPNSPSLIALNKHTGELVAEDNAGISRRIMHGQWSSPSTGKVDSRQLVFLGGGDGFCYAFDAVPRREGAEGFLNVVWKVDCNPAEYKTKNSKPISYPSYDGPSEIVATPVFWRNRVYVVTGQDPEHLSGLGNLTCIDATKANKAGTAGVVWSYRGIQRSVSTVSITPDGLLFIADFSGFLYCLDAESGKVYWVYDAKSHIWGSTLVVDGKVYVGDEDGDVLVLAASKEKKLLSQIDVGAPVYSTPVVANGVLFIANQQHLWAIRDPRTVQHEVAHHNRFRLALATNRR